jgi:hypothetical protein
LLKELKYVELLVVEDVKPTTDTQNSIEAVTICPDITAGPRISHTRMLPIVPRL